MKKRAGIVLLAALLLAAVLYGISFPICPTDRNLEKAIRDYNFTTEIDVEILARQKVGNRLFVLYAQRDHEGWGGLTELERGLFGGYRFRNCSNFDGRTYWTKTVSVGRQPKLLLCGLYDLPDVEYYEVYCGENYVDAGYGGMNPAPFLSVVSIPKISDMFFTHVRYFDADGEEIPLAELKEQRPPGKHRQRQLRYHRRAGVDLCSPCSGPALRNGYRGKNRVSPGW